MNVTLSIDDAVVERARQVARARGTSLNQLIRDHLGALTAGSEPSLGLAELERLWQTESGERSTEKWSREDLYERSVLR